MIENMLKDVFPNAFTHKPETINVHIDKKNAPFTMTDNRACGRCHELRPERENCNGEILKVNNNGHEIAVVDWEGYVGQFGRATEGVSRCDLLMTESGVGHDKIVFCDLCCYEERYVEPHDDSEGKRAYAMNQMDESIEFILRNDNSVIKEYVLTFPEKICLFAWRDYDSPDGPVEAVRGDAMANVSAFLTTEARLTNRKTTHQSVMGHDFIFMQIKYPSEYDW